jgi:hypothetical protein
MPDVALTLLEKLDLVGVHVKAEDRESALDKC